MPELPEVETIRRGLQKFLKNTKIKEAKIFCEKSFIGQKELIKNQEITAINRRGKALLIELKNGITIMIHLRMTGQLIFRGNENFAGGHPTDSFFSELPNSQTRVEIKLENGTLYFNDQRKFGFMKIIKTSEVSNDKFIKSLAKEPWDMTFEEFKNNLMHHKSAPIKATILDQKVIAGIGNIYADEALFFAKVNPKRKTESLSDEEIKNILEGTKTVMQRSIDSGGSTMKTYVKADGTKGDYLKLFAKVFNREGEPCENCKNKIVKIRVAGRGTHICPCCQKEQK